MSREVSETTHVTQVQWCPFLRDPVRCPGHAFAPLPVEPPAPVFSVAPQHLPWMGCRHLVATQSRPGGFRGACTHPSGLARQWGKWVR